MQVLLLAKERPANDPGTPPTPEQVEAFSRYNEELMKAGVVLGAGRLQPSAKGKRVRFEDRKRTVIDGPFGETKELIGGFWLWQVRSLDETVEWLKRAPFDGGTEIEIREIAAELDDTGNATEQERLRARGAKA